MSWYYYDDDRDRRDRLRRKLQRQGDLKALAIPQGSRKLATTFWGKAWCDNLEAYQDYESRLPRGRSYLRQGNVYNLQIEPGVITASVAGSYLYEVRITIKPLASEAWKEIKDDCAGQVGSLLDLLGGKLGDGVMHAITDPDRGLFPHPSEIRLICSCPDAANMCKHVAAVLYGVGVMLDSAPDLFFVLRSVDPSELISSTAQQALGEVQATDAALAGEDLSALFGIDLGVPVIAESEPEKPVTPTKKAKTKKEPVAKNPTPRKPVSSKVEAEKTSGKRAVRKKTR